MLISSFNPHVLYFTNISLIVMFGLPSIAGSHILMMKKMKEKKIIYIFVVISIETEWLYTFVRKSIHWKSN